MKKLINSKIGILFGSLFLAFSTLAFAGCTSNNVPNESHKNNSLNEEPRPAAIKNKEENDILFYSDDYFKHKASRYNEHLATLSIYMADYSMNPGGPDSAEDYSWYLHQPLRLGNFYRLIGFEHPLFNDDYYARTGFDTIGIGCASRVVKEGNNEFTVIACTVRSGGYFLEWENNVFLGDGSNSNMMHEGWYNAANKVIDFIGYYIERLRSQNWLKTTQIKLWMSGFSRGGAVMNIAGGLLDNKLGYDDSQTRFEVYEGVNLKREDIMVYTFEAPQGANIYSKHIELPREALYNNIFNIVNPNDLVTKVAMSRYGFTRFGIDKYITTEFFDPDGFKSARDVVKTLYHERDPKYEWVADNFTSYNIDYLRVVANVADFTSVIDPLLSWLAYGEVFPDVIVEDGYKVNYDANIALDILIDYAIDLIGDRQSYCDNFQKFARGLMRYMFNDLPQDEEYTWKDILILTGLEGLAHDLLPVAEEIVKSRIDLYEITGATPDQINFALDIAFHLFTEYPSEAISLIYNIGDIFENHSTRLNVYHAQAQDSYYVSYYNENHKDSYVMQIPYRKNSEVTRYECLDINQGEIHVNGETVVKMSGDDIGKSSIDVCNKGYAVGYYHYLTYERSEWFVPSCIDFAFGFYGYSDKPWHHVYIKEWTYTTNSIYTRKKRTIVDDYFNGNTQVFSGSYEKDCDPEDLSVDDLTNTTWYIRDPKSPFEAGPITFESNGKTFSTFALKAETEPYMGTINRLYYGDSIVATSAWPELTLNWPDSKYRTIKFTGGDNVKDPTLIAWLFNNAALTIR